MSRSRRRPAPLAARAARHARAAVATLALAAGAFAPREAHAERELVDALHAQGTLVIDQVSGFRLSPEGLTYAGPLGFAVRSTSEDNFVPPGPEGAVTRTQTTGWIAPSLDVFVIDHLSVGGLVEFSLTSNSITFPTGGATEQTNELPSALTFAIVPRVGWYFPLGDRFGVWPRLGLGYVTREKLLETGIGSGVTQRFGAGIVDANVGLVYRFTEFFYATLAPSLTLSVGGRHARDFGGQRFDAGASLLQFGLLGGVGVNLGL